MNKLIVLTLLGVTAFAAPAISVDANAVRDDANDIQSDQGAISKDNVAIGNDNANLSKNRAAKAQDKANGSYGKEAVDSAKIGADETESDSRQAKRSVDNKVLAHHENNLSDDAQKN